MMKNILLGIIVLGLVYLIVWTVSSRARKIRILSPSDGFFFRVAIVTFFLIIIAFIASR